MGRARRARQIAQTAAYGGGVGMAGLGAVGAVGYGLIRLEAVLARRVVEGILGTPPVDRGTYGTGSGRPLEIVVLGDSSAAGLGADCAEHTIGARVARGVSDHTGLAVRLTNVAVVGAKSADLGVQVVNALDAVGSPDVAVILIGANDVTSRATTSVAVRHLREAVAALRAVGAQVVVGTCPDLGTVEPVAQPLRLLARRWSRDMAAAQTVAVVEAGGRTVSLASLLGTEFATNRSELFSVDRFHPSSAGYARLAAVLLPSVFEALGMPAMSVTEPSRPPERSRIDRAARYAARVAGTAVGPARLETAADARRRAWAALGSRARGHAAGDEGHIAPDQGTGIPSSESAAH